MIIKPDIVVTPDRPRVTFREPRDKVEFEREIQRVLWRQGWSLGTYFDVHFVDHDRTRILAVGHFVVAGEREELRTAEPDPDRPITKSVKVYAVQQIGGWLDLVAPMTTKWNVGAGVFEVRRGEEVVGSDPDKARAEAMAKGEVPLAMKAKDKAA